MWNKIKNIIKSRFMYWSNTPKWVQGRRKHCSGCKYNFKNKKWHTPTKKDFIWYYLNGFQNQCTICNCSVRQKTKIKDEYCSLENIGQEPKWDVYENN